MKNYINVWIIVLLTICVSSCASEENIKSGTITLNIPDTFTWAIETPEITVDGEQAILEWQRLQVWDVIDDVSLDMRADYFNDVDTTTIWEYEGYRLVQTVPSLDTPVCTFQTKQLEAAVKQFPNNTFFIISNDTPFALQRFCSDNSINNLVVLSDARTRDFWKSNGLFMPEYGLLARSIFIIDENNEIFYVDYAEEVTGELDLLNALAFLESLNNEE